ncbi:MAG: 50S ribosomal protein L11 methyltransferase [Coprococcus sp.]
MKWTKLTVETTCEAVDLLSAFLDEEGVLGVEIEDNQPLSDEEMAEMYIDLLPDDMPEFDGTAKISCFLDDSYDVEEMKQKIEQELHRLSEYISVGSCRIECSETEDADWINNWKSYFKPFRIYDNIVIKPTWEEIPPDVTDEDIVIEIDPGTAFGTGSHETTKLCIGQLKKYMKSGDKVLDAGSGSGILSFICSRLGAGKVLGIDIDDIAVDVAIENREINNISEEEVSFVCGNIIEDKELAVSIGNKYDIVVANILADVIIPLSGIVQSFMKEDGLFIASGIINIKEEEVRKALLDNNFDIVDTVYMKDWVSFAAKRKR